MARPNIRDTTVVLPESLQLSDVQVAEIKKAFNLFDRDADGFIDAVDLKPGAYAAAHIAVYCRSYGYFPAGVSLRCRFEDDS